MEKIRKTRHILIKLEASIVEATLISVLMYGCETWIVTIELEGKLNRFATGCVDKLKTQKLADWWSQYQ